MRILQVHTRYREAGGEDRVVAAEAELLRSAGHKVEQLIADNPAAAVPATVALLQSPRNPKWRRVVERCVARFKPDVAHVHNTWFALSPAVVDGLQTAAVPTVMTVHNYRLMCINGMLLRDGQPCEDCVGRSPWPGIRHRCYRDSLIASTTAAATIVYNRVHRTWDRGIALYLAPTNFVRDRLLDGGVPAERVRVRPHFVEDPGERAAPPSQSRIILYVGRLSEDKGAHVLFDAWSSFGDTGLELVCVGEGPLREEIARRNIPSVRLMGALAPADVRDWMLRARVLVAPSTWYETFGLVVAEAMAAALPVIVPRIGALAEVAAGGAAVAHTEFADVRSLNNDLVAALQVARDDGLIDVAGKSGRARFSATFTPAAGLARLMDAYRHAIRSNADAATAPVSAGNE